MSRDGNSPYLLLHLVSREALTPLVASQVVDHAEWQAVAEGPGAPAAVAVGILEPLRVAVSRALRERLREFATRAPHVKVTLLPFLGRALRWSTALLARKIARLAGGRDIVMHCRGEEAVIWGSEFAARLVREGLRIGIVADIRGAWPDEFLLARGFDGPDRAPPDARAGYDFHLDYLRKALDRANAILTVSRPLAKWLVSHGAIGSRITPVPCAVSRLAYSAETRAKARHELGVSPDTLVLAYVGSIAAYQHVEDGALRFVRHALDRDDRVCLLVLTNEAASFRRLIAKAGISQDKCRVMSLPQAAVPGFLCAADAGLLLRAPNRVNEVSLPVKLAEYLSCGVPVIVSRITGWVDELVERDGAGLAVSWFGASEAEQERETRRVIDELRSDLAGYRARALKLCREQFLWSAHTEAVRQAYIGALRLKTGAATNARHAARNGSDAHGIARSGSLPSL